MQRRRVHTDEQITVFLTELESQTDRGAALIAAAVLDEILESFITARLLDVGRDHHDALFGRGKPLDSFSAKIELGYQLGLYTNAARTQLEMIREVRNKFAHRIEPLQFDHPTITKIISSRRLKKTPKGEPPRKEFIGIFASVAAALYGLSAADVRLRPLMETHTAYIQQMAEAALRAAAQAQEKGPHKPGS